jgi:hypothetical protein
MTKSVCVPVLAGLAVSWAGLLAAGQGHPHPPAPQDLVQVEAGGETLTIWPYTTSDFRAPSDPINLVFPNADPRAIRQALIGLDGARPGFPAVPGADCRWTDAMGYEQAAYGRPRGWAGGEVQLACVHANAPLGDPFRFHVRLFRVGKDTIGNGHFEILIPGSAEHEVLSWDLARDLVAYDAARLGTAPAAVPVLPEGSFRAVRRLVYDELIKDPGLAGLLALLGVEPAGDGDVPIPTSGEAAALATAIVFQPGRTTAVTTTQVSWGIVVPKPFCATGPYDLVELSGPLNFTMSVRTGDDGRYERTYVVGGTLTGVPLGVIDPSGTIGPVGPPAAVPVFEVHRAELDDHRGQVTESAEQTLLGVPVQSKIWHFEAGGRDRYDLELACGGPDPRFARVDLSK